MASIFGYFRLHDLANNSHAAQYSAQLRAAGATAVYEDDGVPWQRPEFDQLLHSSGRGDVIAVVRLTHFSTNERVVLQLIHRIEAAHLNLIVIEGHVDTRKHDGQQAFRLAEAISKMPGFIIMEGGDGGGNGH